MFCLWTSDFWRCQPSRTILVSKWQSTFSCLLRSFLLISHLFLFPCKGKIFFSSREGNWNPIPQEWSDLWEPTGEWQQGDTPTTEASREKGQQGYAARKTCPTLSLLHPIYHSCHMSPPVSADDTACPKQSMQAYPPCPLEERQRDGQSCSLLKDRSPLFDSLPLYVHMYYIICKL